MPVSLLPFGFAQEASAKHSMSAPYLLHQPWDQSWNREKMMEEAQLRVASDQTLATPGVLHSQGLVHTDIPWKRFVALVASASLALMEPENSARTVAVLARSSEQRAALEQPSLEKRLAWTEILQLDLVEAFEQTGLGPLGLV